MVEPAALTIDDSENLDTSTNEPVVQEPNSAVDTNTSPPEYLQNASPDTPGNNDVATSSPARPLGENPVASDLKTAADEVQNSPQIKDVRSPTSPGAKMRAPQSTNAVDLGSIRNIKVKVEAVLGGISMPVSQLAQIKHGEIIHLERQIGEEIEITANGQLIGRGEIVVIEEDTPKFGISLTEIL